MGGARGSGCGKDGRWTRDGGGARDEGSNIGIWIGVGSREDESGY